MMNLQAGQRVFIEIYNDSYDSKFLTGEITELYTDDSENMAEVFLDQSVTIHVKQDKLTAIESGK